jgi:hypothetical protein
MDFAQWANRRGIDILELHPPVLPEIQKLGLEDEVAAKTIDYHRPVLERPQVLAMVGGRQSEIVMVLCGCPRVKFVMKGTGG